jgi:hypothetical protein
MLGACVAWDSAAAPGNVTVTLNPGVANVDYGKGPEPYYVFSFYDERYNPPLIPNNGPSASDSLTLAFKPSERIKGGVVRELTSEGFHDSNGQIYYKDIQSGEPVMNTIVLPGTLDASFVSGVCDKLRQHKPLGPTA